MVTAALYEVAFVSKAGVRHHSHRGAPTETWLVARGLAKGAAFVIRYFPSKKGWRILDIRQARNCAVSGGVAMFRGQVRGDKFWPTEDAAVMYALSKLAGHISTP